MGLLEMPGIDPFDLEQFRSSPEEIARIHAARAKAAKIGRRRKRQAGVFIAGPFPWGPYCITAKLPGKAAIIWQLVHHRVRLTREAAVTLPDRLLADVGISRFAKARALHDLARVGLIQVDYSAGRSPRVSLVEFPDTDAEQ